MTKIFFIRHCETEWNSEKRMQGWNDSAPSEKGVQQAQALAERMKTAAIDAIYSSPTGRAYFTAKQVQSYHKCEIVTDDRLREINLGRWEGMLESDLLMHDAQRYHAFWKDPASYITDGGESFVDVGMRMKDFLDDISVRDDSKTIMVVSHTVAIRMLALFITGRNITDLWKDAVLKPTSVTEINIDSGTHILSWGDGTHLNQSADQ